MTFRFFRRLHISAALCGIGLGLLLAAAPQSVFAVPASCPPNDGTAAATLTTYAGTVSIDTGYGQSDLKRLHRRHGTRSLGKDWRALGLTATERQMDLGVKARVTPLGRGTYCALPESVELRVGFPRFTIYIDRKYRGGSCPYRAALEHEHEHVALYRAALDRFAPRLKALLEREVRRMKPVRAATPEGAVDGVTARLKRKLLPLMREMDRHAEKANAAIDSPENYRRIQGACQDW